MSNQTVSLRDYVGAALNECYQDRLYVLDGDLSGATRTAQFQQAHPSHFIQCGISETSGVSIATGLAMEGMIPFYVNFALFCSGSAWTQVRMACYAQANVKLLATHPGMDNGPDGASHHGNEDLALMRVLPGMTILLPQSPAEVQQAIACAMALQGPCYVRVSRDAVPVLPATLADGQPFGGVKRIWDEGEDFAIVYEGSALAAAADGFALLRSNGKKGKMVQVQTLKPFPGAALMQMIGGVQKIVTVENHSVVGGLGSAVADELCRQPAHPPLLRVGVPDVFTQSGSTTAVKSRYGLSGAHIAQLLEG
ncbi:MAG: transketolase C-terminal domain-containing protein [Candidatus Limiplasma sp.]|nr:transketolase C-terminal domain-containing protein [Candidatus Limiplasma sp.]